MDSASATVAKRYTEKFGKHPNFITIRLDEHNNKHFVAACQKAIDAGIPITDEEFEEIEKLTYPGIGYGINPDGSSVLT